MSNQVLSKKSIKILTATVSVLILSACGPAPQPQPAPSETPESAEYLSVISVGFEGRMLDVRVDDDVTAWLNDAGASTADAPPVPAASDWQAFAAPSGEASIRFEPRARTPFDVLEILAYPDGLDESGVPITVDVHPLCGPQADISCGDAAWGTTGVEIASEKIDAAIADTEYYAIGGILLPDGDSHPDSFMALLRKNPS